MHLNPCSTTSGEEAVQFWKVTLKHSYLVTRYVVYNREGQTGRRLNGFKLESQNDRGYVVFNYTDKTSTTNLVYNILTVSWWRATVKTTKIELTQSSTGETKIYLTLCEVEIFGECAPGTWGLECLPCNLCYNQSCLRDTGLCVHGCVGHRQPPGCKEDCRPGTWGISCSGNCSHCYENLCDIKTGTCEKACAGYSNFPVCDTCASGKWGVNCKQACKTSKCQHNTCNKDTGLCSLGCAGFRDFPECSLECSPGTWGINCTQTCKSSHCYKNVCDKDTGFCKFGCYGFKDFPTCTASCNRGMWGVNCSKRCHNCYIDSCSKDNGICDIGCDGFSDFPHCTVGCNPGTWGVNCNYFCHSKHCHLNSCDKDTGLCDMGCFDFMDFPTCAIPCKSGNRGVNCSLLCRCDNCYDNDGVCDPRCSKYKALIDCSIGREETLKCNCKNNLCEEDGSCINKTSCKRGWFAEKCKFRDVAVTSVFDVPLLNDGDDATCYFPSENSITAYFSRPVTFTWLRLVFSGRVIPLSLSLTFGVVIDKMRMSRNCSELTEFGVYDAYIDVYCHEENLIHNLNVMWTGKAMICSLHISGGRNFATDGHIIIDEANRNEAQSKKYRVILTDGMDTPYSCVDLTEQEGLSLQYFLESPRAIKMIDIYTGKESVEEFKFTIEYVDKYGIIRFSDLFSSPDTEFRLSLPNGPLLSKIVIHLTSGNMSLCELEILGDCPPRYYDSTCSVGCSPTCLNRACNFEGACYECIDNHTGWNCSSEQQVLRMARTHELEDTEKIKFHVIYLAFPLLVLVLLVAVFLLHKNYHNNKPLVMRTVSEDEALILTTSSKSSTNTLENAPLYEDSLFSED